MSVVVAVDGSEASTRAARAGLELLGDVRDAVIVTVIDAGDPMEVTGTGMAGGTISADAFDERERVRATEGSAIVTAAAGALGIPGAETRVLRGDPAAMLCELAANLPRARSSSALVAMERSSARSSGPCRTTSCATRRAPSW